MKSLFIYHRNKVGFEKYEFVRNLYFPRQREDVDLDGYYSPESYLVNYFEKLYDAYPTIKYYDMPIKINQIKFADMLVAFDNGNELILAERVPIIKIKGV